jgi:hypothetical protein
VDPLAAELAKVSLWLETLDPGRPLTFLDAQIKVGNALIGTTPKLLADGLPDEAFQPIEGDDKNIARTLARQNRAERTAQGSLFDIDMAAATAALGEEVQQVVSAPALSLADVHLQRKRFRAHTDSAAYRRQHLAADAWCAAFVWPKTPGAPTAPTHATIAALAAGEDALSAVSRAEVQRLAAEYRFFHWHLEFPHLFPTAAGAGDSVNPATGWAGGFSVVLANPPWELIELREQEFFELRDPDIARTTGAKRKKLIAELIASGQTLGREYIAEKRRTDGVRHFGANSGRYPLCGRGRIKTDPLFAETGRDLLASAGRFGMILPTGIATDSTTQYFFNDLVVKGAIASLYDFENSKPLFEGVHRSYKFCLLTLVGRESRESQAEFAFFAHSPTDLQRTDVCFTLSPDEITLLNPNTGTCPVFRRRRDADITLGIYKRMPVLIREDDPNANLWRIKFRAGLFDMTAGSHLFHTRDELEGDGWELRRNTFKRGRSRMLPLYEGKMIAMYDHRAADVVKSKTAGKRQNQPRYLTDLEHSDPNRLAMPWYWVSEADIPGELPDARLGFFRITSPTNQRTFVATLLPPVAAGDSIFLLEADNKSCLEACFNSYVFDFVARQKLAGLNMLFYIVKQLPVIPPDLLDRNVPWDRSTSLKRWINDRVVELNYTAYDLELFARSLGFNRTPYAWDLHRRQTLRAELDAAFFRLYGIERDDVDYIMETFPIVKRKDIAEHGEYRTKQMILEIYDAMAEAEMTGVPYASPLDDDETTSKAGAR